MSIWVFLIVLVICATIIVCTWMANNDWADFYRCVRDVEKEVFAARKCLKELCEKIEKLEMKGERNEVS